MCIKAVAGLAMPMHVSTYVRLYGLQCGHKVDLLSVRRAVEYWQKTSRSQRSPSRHVMVPVLNNIARLLRSSEAVLTVSLY